MLPANVITGLRWTMAREYVTNRISHRSTDVSKIIQSVRDVWWKRNARVISKYIAQVFGRSARTPRKRSTNNYNPLLLCSIPTCTRGTQKGAIAPGVIRVIIIRNYAACSVEFWNLTFDVYNFRNKLLPVIYVECVENLNTRSFYSPVNSTGVTWGTKNL